MAAIAVAIAWAGSTPRAFAFGFGSPQVQSTLGEPLRLRIPVRAESDVELTPQCLRLVNDADDPLPTISALSGTQVRIEGRAADRALEIESRYPVNEPLVHLIIEAGCAEPVRREFTLLLDPPQTSPRNPAPSAAAVRVAPVPPPPDLSLGMPRVFAQVGRPLAMQIPVGGSAAATLPARCVHLTDALSGDGAPVVHHADVLITHDGGGTEIRLVTPRPVTEPAVRVAVSVGCTAPLQREYGVLLDMPATPAGAAAPATLAAAAAATRSDSGPAASRPPRHHAATFHRLGPRPAVRHGGRPATGPRSTPAPTHPRTIAAAPPHPHAALPHHPRPAKSHDQDRLVLASAPADTGTGSTVPDAASAQMAAMNDRIADLTRQIRILQTELVADRTRERQLTNREFALQSQLAAQERSSGLAWVAAMAITAALIAAGALLWIRRQGAHDHRRRSWEAIVPESATEQEATDFPPSPRDGQRTVPAQPAPSMPMAPAPDAVVSRRDVPPMRPLPRENSAPRTTAAPASWSSATMAESDDELTDDHTALTEPRRHRIEVVELHHPTAHRTETAVARAEPEDITRVRESPPAPEPAFAPASWPDGNEELAVDSGLESIFGAHPAAVEPNGDRDIPLTQIPTMLSLDLDLSTDLTPLSGVEPGTRR